jgi:AraC-like DNA-binding protein
MKLMEVLLLMSRAPESDREYILENPYQSNSGPLARLAAEKGVTYIFNNIDKKIRLQDAAKLSFMSESHFSRVFKEASGLTFSNMIRKLRIEHGCNLLVSTELPIAIISKDCGFTNLSNFNRQFLREMGVSPRAFRALQIRQRVALLEQVFGHKNQLLQQTKINNYIDKNSSQVSEYMTKVPTNKHVSEPKN